ncbi:MAG: hypothetical protein WDN23_04675 [Edaphobacter sp.]
MSHKLLALAAEHLGELSAAETTVLTAIEDGLEAGSPSLSGAKIRASLVEWLCTDRVARISIHRHGLALNGFTITGILDLIHADVPFPLQFHWCVFAEMIWLKSARLRSLSFRGSSLRGLNADSAVIETNVLMIDGFESVGEVAFREANVGSSFRADGAKFSGSPSQALVCDRIRVSGGVVLSQFATRSTFNGEVRFSGADVGGNFDCEGATFCNPGGNALSADRIKTGGSVFLRGSRGTGEIIVGASKIGVALDCRGAVFASTGERTLNAERALVGSHVLLDGQFHCDKVHFLAVTIEGGLRCRLGKIGKLDLRHAQVEGPFEWTDMIDPSASSIDFRDARLESIKDDEASWPHPGVVQFDGLRFERFSESVTDVKARLRWLKLDTSGPAQAYRQLSFVYEQGGRNDFSRRVLFSFEELTRARQSGIGATVWNFLLRWTIGYGYKLWRAAILMLAFTIIGFGIGVVGYRAKLIAPTDKDANAFFIATDRTPTQYPRFSASMYSIEHSLPGVNLGVASSWSADTTAQWPKHRNFEPVVRFWFWFQTLLGWLLSIFFVAGISGVVKSPR